MQYDRAARQQYDFEQQTQRYHLTVKQKQWKLYQTNSLKMDGMGGEQHKTFRPSFSEWPIIPMAGFLENLYYAQCQSLLQT